MKRSEIDELTKWMKEKLAGKAASVKVTTRLDTHPCVITLEEMAAARHFIRTQSHQLPENRRYDLLQPELEINPKYALVHQIVCLINQYIQVQIFFIHFSYSLTY